MMARFLKTPWPGIAWVILIFVLLALPGSSFPDAGFLNIPHLDKVVHFILFWILVYLWAFYFSGKQPPVSFFRRIILVIAILSCAYGIAMEFYQKYFVANRMFDGGDVIADAAGAFGGFFYSSLRLPQKNKPL
ncbi:MAG: VanZ family protein [Chitinophagaceae bacterium]|nr:VanZ family protein [Chitinophagaceae bacterium]